MAALVGYRDDHPEVREGASRGREFSGPFRVLRSTTVTAYHCAPLTTLPLAFLTLSLLPLQVCQQALATLLALCHAPANRQRLAALGVEPRVRALLRSGAFSGSDPASVGGHGGKGSPVKSPKKKRNAAKAEPSVAARLCDALQVGIE